MATESLRQQNLELGRRMNDPSNARDDALWGMFSPAIAYHTGGQTIGLEAARRGDEQLFAAIPDAVRTIDNEVSDETMLVHHWHFDGTAKATGTPVRWEGCSWMRIEDGLFVEAWTFWDPSQLQPRRTSEG